MKFFDLEMNSSLAGGALKRGGRSSGYSPGVTICGEYHFKHGNTFPDMCNDKYKSPYYLPCHDSGSITIDENGQIVK